MNSPLTEAAGPWIRRFHPRPDARVRLVCLPHAGGSASFYFPVSRSMPEDVDVLTDRLNRVLDAEVGEYERMQRASLELVAAHDITRTLDTFEALYRGEQIPA